MKAFEILGLPESATSDEVKARWRDLAFKHHPDKGGDTSEFSKYRRAYEEALSQTTERDKLCVDCQGTGRKEHRRGFYFSRTLCTTCNGDGKR